LPDFLSAGLDDYHVDVVRRRLLTAATDGPIVHLPGTF
jgi:hypothetical protein